MVYDIRISENAQQTLVDLTGVPISVWKRYLRLKDTNRYIEDLIEEVMLSYGNFPHNYRDFEFIYFHVTTSANNCSSFRKHGILDLKKSYSCHDSELRTFLEKHGIHINLDEKVLTYNDRVYDITYGDCPSHGTEAYKRWLIGRKLYFDYATCGFLSIWDQSSYGGEVHIRPEILMNIDDLLRLKLSREWASSHAPYKIVAKVKGENIVYDGDENQSEKDKVLNYLTKAYWNAFDEPNENILILKNNVQIPPADIIEIKPMKCWKNC